MGNAVSFLDARGETTSDGLQSAVCILNPKSADCRRHQNSHQAFTGTQTCLSRSSLRPHQEPSTSCLQPAPLLATARQPVLRKIARAWVAEDSGVLRRQRRQGMVGVRGLLAVAAGQSGQDRGARGEVRVQSAGTAPVEMNAEFSQLRSRESAPDRALREFVDVEIEFQKGAFLQDAEEAAAGVRGLVKCRQMSRYLRALDGGNARLDSLRERCAQAVTRQVALIQPAQIAVALNAAEFRASSAVEGFYVAAAVRLLEMDFAELRTKDVILILGALARAATNSNFGARANSSTSPGTRLVVWSLQDGRRLALHLCRGLLAHRDRRNREMGVLGGGGLNSIDVAGVLNALGKLFPNSLGRRSVSGGYQWGEEGGGEWGGDGGGGGRGGF